MILDPIESGSAKSLASLLTGRTSKEYVVAIRRPDIYVVYVRPRLANGTLFVVVSTIILPDLWSSSKLSTTCYLKYLFHHTCKFTKKKCLNILSCGPSWRRSVASTCKRGLWVRLPLGEVYVLGCLCSGNCFSVIKVIFVIYLL